MKNPKFRVINPTKSEFGKVSKQMLTEIILAVKSKSQVLQWQNSDATVDWFQKLENKHKLTGKRYYCKWQRLEFNQIVPFFF
jgi:hypothetical protein